MAQPVIREDTQPPAETLASKYENMGVHDRATAMADDCVGDPWELLGYFREKLRQSERDAEQARDAATRAVQRVAALTRRADGDAETVATIADLQRRRASDLDAVVNLSLCLKEAREALEWYRDTVGRCRMMHAEGDEARNALHKDCGERAEKALAFRVPAREPKHDQ